MTDETMLQTEQSRPSQSEASRHTLLRDTLASIQQKFPLLTEHILKPSEHRESIRLDVSEESYKKALDLEIDVRTFLVNMLDVLKFVRRESKSDRHHRLNTRSETQASLVKVAYLDAYIHTVVKKLRSLVHPNEKQEKSRAGYAVRLASLMPSVAGIFVGAGSDQATQANVERAMQDTPNPYVWNADQDLNQTQNIEAVREQCQTIETLMADLQQQLPEINAISSIHLPDVVAGDDFRSEVEAEFRHVCAQYGIDMPNETETELGPDGPTGPEQSGAQVSAFSLNALQMDELVLDSLVEHFSIPENVQNSFAVPVEITSMSESGEFNLSYQLSEGPFKNVATSLIQANQELIGEWLESGYTVDLLVTYNNVDDANEATLTIRAKNMAIPETNLIVSNEGDRLVMNGADEMEEILKIDDYLKDMLEDHGIDVELGAYIVASSVEDENGGRHLVRIGVRQADGTFSQTWVVAEARASESENPATPVPGESRTQIDEPILVNRVVEGPVGAESVTSAHAEINEFLRFDGGLESQIGSAPDGSLYVLDTVNSPNRDQEIYSDPDFLEGQEVIMIYNAIKKYNLPGYESITWDEVYHNLDHYKEIARTAQIDVYDLDEVLDNSSNATSEQTTLGEAFDTGIGLIRLSRDLPENINSELIGRSPAGSSILVKDSSGKIYMLLFNRTDASRPYPENLQVALTFSQVLTSISGLNFDGRSSGDEGRWLFNPWFDFESRTVRDQKISRN